MLGCHAEAASVEIDVDPVEIEEARWFPREQVREAVAIADGRAEPSPSLDFAVPPPLTIAYQLIRAWASGEL
jgi:NAD+ diphosphatase